MTDLSLAGQSRDRNKQILQTENFSNAVPFIKWAGGKRGILPSLSKHFPEHVDTYWEPFVGGGAVFFGMVDRITHAFLSDTNEELIITYNVVKNDVASLIDRLKHHAEKHKVDSYYMRVRVQQPTDHTEIAARFIYLNKTCYNGLYRVNRSGQFNVPKGTYKHPNICDEERLRGASRALQKATIMLGDFNNVINLSRNDFVYCDPPYDGCFTNYQPGGFAEEDQSRLRDSVLEWVSEGAKVMVSNSNTALIRRLYQGRPFNIHPVQAPRHINSNGNGRGSVTEVIITSYDL